jgi:hypothetical protein
VAKELGYQWGMALDCWYWCYGYWLGGVRCNLALEQACAVEIDNHWEENTVVDVHGNGLGICICMIKIKSV